MFKIPNKDTKLSEIYGFLEKNRNSFQLADYSVSQPTLDNVFEEISAEKERKKKHKTARTTGKKDKKANNRQEDNQNDDIPSTSKQNAKK